MPGAQQGAFTVARWAGGALRRPPPCFRHDRRAACRSLGRPGPRPPSPYPPGESVAICAYAAQRLKKVVDGVGEPRGTYKVEFLTGTNGFFAPENGAGVAALEAAIRARTGKKACFLNATGVGDGRYFADDGIEIINFGPGSETQGHAANESVPIAQMEDAAHILLAAVLPERGAPRESLRPENQDCHPERSEGSPAKDAPRAIRGRSLAALGMTVKMRIP
ncbi:M20/M25/M40 family metallo-hydrolase [Vineibacter terrae]|uniref:M20/M25/M40 family metallo-hydrolase n=1 Tax=Vineibacter terrae TaxID=2586908 RepID=A0A5C8PJT3_9HYPH|nr:M20/M25/M40 family metallo-hydrolase [Vineibacter terrae]TXL73619.1 M20/M25/M40 family metallo-hydrolase [Vineibacter terrae]